MQTLIISLISTDTVGTNKVALQNAGLITQVAAIIQQHQGCWQTSNLTELGGHLAGILEVEVPAQQAAALSQALQQLLGLHVALFTAKAAKNSGQAAQLTLTAIHRPGIMAQLTAVLAQLNISIKALQTTRYAAPTTDTSIFEANCVIILPHGQLLHDLHQQLQALGDDLAVDIDLIATL